MNAQPEGPVNADLEQSVGMEVVLRLGFSPKDMGANCNLFRLSVIQSFDEKAIFLGESDMVSREVLRGVLDVKTLLGHDSAMNNVYTFAWDSQTRGVVRVCASSSMQATLFAFRHIHKNYPTAIRADDGISLIGVSDGTMSTMSQVSGLLIGG